MNYDTLYIARKPAYTEKRDERYLLIWPDIPNWMVVDEEAFRFITHIQGEYPLAKIVETYKEIASSSVKDDEILSFVKGLENSYILYNKDDGPPYMPIGEPKIQSLILYPTSKCNLRCIMCYNKYNLEQVTSHAQELETHEFITFLDDINPFLAEKTNIQVLGGEPLIVPEKTLKVIEYASPFVDRISMSTNGTVITPEIARALASVKNLSVQVSLDSPYKEPHEALRGKHTFDKTIAGIKTLVENNATIVMNMVCHTQNMDEIEPYYNLAHVLGVDRVRFSPMQKAGAGIDCGLKAPSYRALLDMGIDIMEKHPEYKKFLGSDFSSTMAGICRRCGKQSWCGTGERVVMLNSDGSVYPCPNHHLPEFKAGNIREQSFKEIWENSPVLQKIRKTYPVDQLNEECAACPVRNWCVGWCRGETYQITHSMREPSVMCEQVKQIIIDMFFYVSQRDSVFGQLAKSFGQAQDLNRL
ncbi:MAG: radical SAM protein [Candidatus Methanofastidiosia archaeon]|jgi:radical SAM protein with 4Fe4S-binding SPASM domain